MLIQITRYHCLTGADDIIESSGSRAFTYRGHRYNNLNEANAVRMRDAQKPHYYLPNAHSIEDRVMVGEFGIHTLSPRYKDQEYGSIEAAREAHRHDEEELNRVEHRQTVETITHAQAGQDDIIEETRLDIASVRGQEIERQQLSKIFRFNHVNYANFRDAQHQRAQVQAQKMRVSEIEGLHFVARLFAGLAQAHPKKEHFERALTNFDQLIKIDTQRRDRHKVERKQVHDAYERFKAAPQIQKLHNDAIKLAASARSNPCQQTYQLALAQYKKLIEFVNEDQRDGYKSERAQLNREFEAYVHEQERRQQQTHARVRAMQAELHHLKLVARIVQHEAIIQLGQHHPNDTKVQSYVKESRRKLQSERERYHQVTEVIQSMKRVHEFEGEEKLNQYQHILGQIEALLRHSAPQDRPDFERFKLNMQTELEAEQNLATVYNLELDDDGLQAFQFFQPAAPRQLGVEEHFYCAPSLQLEQCH